MQKSIETPATLKVEIETESLKGVVKEGRLMEFAETVAALAGREIRYQLVELLTEAGVGLSELGETVAIETGFTMIGKYGTRPPRPWPPWPRPTPDPWDRTEIPVTLETELRRIVRDEIAHG
jgi:hypothetical protein